MLLSYQLKKVLVPSILFLSIFVFLTSCKSISYTKEITTVAENLVLNLKLSTTNIRENNSVKKTFVYGAIEITNSNSYDKNININQISLEIDNTRSEMCYFDSIASILGNLEIKGKENKLIHLYWVFEGDYNFRNPKIVTITLGE